VGHGFNIDWEEKGEKPRCTGVGFPGGMTGYRGALSEDKLMFKLKCFINTKELLKGSAAGTLKAKKNFQGTYVAGGNTKGVSPSGWTVPLKKLKKLAKSRHRKS